MIHASVRAVGEVAGGLDARGLLQLALEEMRSVALGRSE